MNSVKWLFFLLIIAALSLLTSADPAKAIIIMIENQTPFVLEK